jgi:mannose-6-phosphate isomerase-like protein (cupin superfamily)
MSAMARVSRDSASEVQDRGLAEDRTEHVEDGYTINFVSIREDADLTPMLRGLPGDACQCSHWGYLLKGKMTVRYADREEVIEAGDAFYLPPGHVPSSVAGTEFVQFSRTDELLAVQAAMEANMRKMTGG